MLTKASLVLSIVLGLISVFYGTYCISGKDEEEKVASSLELVRLANLRHQIDTLKMVADICFREDLLSNEIGHVNVLIELQRPLRLTLNARGPLSTLQECILGQLLVMRELESGHRRQKLWADVRKKYTELYASLGFSYTPTRIIK